MWASLNKSPKLSELFLHQRQHGENNTYRIEERLKWTNVHEISLWILKCYRNMSCYSHRRENVPLLLLLWWWHPSWQLIVTWTQISLVGIESLGLHLCHLSYTEASPKHHLYCFFVYLASLLMTHQVLDGIRYSESSSIKSRKSGMVWTVSGGGQVWDNSLWTWWLSSAYFPLLFPRYYALYPIPSPVAMLWHLLLKISIKERIKLKST